MHATQSNGQLDPEQWRPVPGYEGSYEVSDHGRVRSLDRQVPHAKYGTMRVRGGVLQLLNVHGRAGITLHDCGKRRQALVHSLMLEAFIGPRPPGHQACHGDGDKRNNRLGNLRWDTASGNALDQVRHGVHKETRKTHCPRRHELIAPNLRTGRGGRRECLACHRARTVQARAKRRGQDFDFVAYADGQYSRLRQRAGASGPRRSPLRGHCPSQVPASFRPVPRHPGPQSILACGQRSFASSLDPEPPTDLCGAGVGRRRAARPLNRRDRLTTGGTSDDRRRVQRLAIRAAVPAGPAAHRARRSCPPVRPYRGHRRRRRADG